MYLVENPVLERELLVNLRMTRAFVLLFCYVALLGLLVYVAWPSQQRLDLTARPKEATQLVNLFFLGQYVLLSLMAPTFAAGTISGEKERKTYEMLLASPLRPGAIVLGKLLASLCHLAVLGFCSLPIVMLCLPLGGVSPWEVLATYVAMAASAVFFGAVSVAASSYFRRTIAALVVSYLVILPGALLGVVLHNALETAAAARLVFLLAVTPGVSLAATLWLLARTSRRLLYPPDVGAEAQEVLDPDREQESAVGMIIRSDQFPDVLFAPRKRAEVLPDGANPVFDKELRNEIFGQGTLMLRLVIQLSMCLALPLMAVCLYIWPKWAAWYTGYVLVFNMLVGPVFSAGSVSSERERQTLDLLLTTALSPWQILSGKLWSGLRISCVLTAFLTWPLLLAWFLPPWTFWSDSLTMAAYLAIVAVSCVTTTVTALSSSVLFRKTSTAMMSAYLAIAILFAAPLAAEYFARIFFPGAALTEHISQFTFSSPFAVARSLPLTLGEIVETRAGLGGTWSLFTSFLGFYGCFDLLLLLAMIRLFHARWRVVE